MNREQLLFNRVRDHLIKQGAHSINDNACVYRAPDGRSCAIGCLIRDEDYVPAFENTNITNNHLLREAIERFLGHELAEHEVALLYALQDIHDNNEPEEWPDALEELAGEHSLDY